MQKEIRRTAWTAEKRFDCIGFFCHVQNMAGDWGSGGRENGGSNKIKTDKKVNHVEMIELDILCLLYKM